MCGMLRTLVLKLGCALESRGQFFKLLMPGPTCRDSSLTGLECGSGTGIFKSPLVDFNV